MNLVQASKCNAFWAEDLATDNEVHLYIVSFLIVNGQYSAVAWIQSGLGTEIPKDKTKKKNPAKKPNAKLPKKTLK